MKTILSLAAFWAAGIAVAYASPVTPACAAGALSGVYTNTNGTQNGFVCEINDKIYSNFAYVTTGADPDAAQVTVGVDNNIGLKQTGFQLGSAVQGLDWETAGFSLSYTVTVDQTACAAVYGSGDTCTITGAQGQFQGALAPNTAAMTDSLTPGGTLNLNDLTTNANTGQINPLSPTGMTTTNIVLFGTAAGSSDPIDSFGFDIFETATSSSVVPEPATLGLMGSGLLGLGLIRRRRTASKLVR